MQAFTEHALRQPARLPVALMAVAALAVAATLAGCVVAPARPYPAQRTTYHAPPPEPATYYYAEHEQTPEKQDRDRYACYRWAQRQTGVDPGMTPVQRTAVAAPPPDPQPGRDTALGAFTGAAVGAVASPWHTSEHMVIGAVLGGLLGAASDTARAESTERAYEARQARADAANARAQVPVADFRRAMNACMSGRGYTIG